MIILKKKPLQKATITHNANFNKFDNNTQEVYPNRKVINISEKTYSINKNKIHPTILFFKITMILLTFYLIVLWPFVEGEFKDKLFSFSLISFSIIISTILYFISRNHSLKVERDRFIYKSGFKTIELLYSDVLGVTNEIDPREEQKKDDDSDKSKNTTNKNNDESDDEFLYIIPKNKSKEIIAVSEIFKDYEELKDWAFKYFSPATNYDYHQHMIFQKSKYANDHKEQKILADNTENIVIALSLISILITISSMIWKYNLFYATIIFLSLPLLGISYYWANKGPMKLLGVFLESKTLNAILILPTLALFIKISTNGYKVHDYSNGTLIFCIITIILFISCIIYPKITYNYDRSFSIRSIFYSMCFAILYSYTAIISINETFDEKITDLNATEIIDKEAEISKDPNYYLHFRALGSDSKIIKLSVEKELYNKTKKGDFIAIEYYKGLLDIPYYHITKIISNDKKEIKDAYS
ncbi:MAG: hypothetical protein ACEPOV_06285 [Hyphomicrobiales bacterium]